MTFTTVSRVAPETWTAGFELYHVNAEGEDAPIGVVLREREGVPYRAFRNGRDLGDADGVSAAANLVIAAAAPRRVVADGRGGWVEGDR